jgi:hypothetical protein
MRPGVEIIHRQVGKYKRKMGMRGGLLKTRKKGSDPGPSDQEKGSDPFFNGPKSVR